MAQALTHVRTDQRVGSPGIPQAIHGNNLPGCRAHPEVQQRQAGKLATKIASKLGPRRLVCLGG